MSKPTQPTFRPSAPPYNQDQLREYLYGEFNHISDVLNSLRDVDYVKFNNIVEAFARVSEGMMMRADGTYFDPGLGSGVYIYNGASYRLINPLNENWHAPTFSGTWANYGGAYQSAGYRMEPDGWVSVRGVIASGTINTAAFTLPAPYRPLATVMMPAFTDSGIGRVEVSSAGVVTPVSGGTTYFSLDGLRFHTS